MTTIIAEKPSVARCIASVVGADRDKKEWLEGNGYYVTWCRGHLLELYTKEADGNWDLSKLPILPDSFELSPIPSTRNNEKPRLEVIKELLGRSDEIIVATDAGREGELIFRNVYKYLRCFLPFKRLWVSSLTEKAIAEGMSNLYDGHDFDNLAVAAEQRNYADWLVGINATRALTLAVGAKQVLSLGRVQTVVLRFICERYLENKNFVPEKYFFLRGESVEDGISFRWRGVVNYSDERTGMSARDAVLGRGYLDVDKVKKERVTEQPPLLYDINAIQKEGNTRYGFTAKQVEEIVQALYLRGLVTYPRTGSRYISEDMFETIPSLLKSMKGRLEDYDGIIDGLTSPGTKLNRRCVNDTKLTDHHGLLVTEITPNNLTDEEQKIYGLIFTRTLETFSAPCIADITKVELSSGEYCFETRGRKEVFLGWKNVSRNNEKDDVELDDVDEIEMDMRPLPEMTEGQRLDISKLELVKDQTKPKPILTDARLITMLEKAGRQSDNKEVNRVLKDIGIGTPATRAEALEVVIQRGYVDRNGKKKLIPTELGLLVYGATREKAIASVELTAQWEAILADIEDGKREPDKFYDAVKRFADYLVKDITSGKDLEKIRETLAPQIIHCPDCGAEMRIYEKSAKCTKCGCIIWRDIAGKHLAEDTMRKLIKDGETSLLTGFKSKAGKTFSARVKLQPGGKTTLIFDK